MYAGSSPQTSRNPATIAAATVAASALPLNLSGATTTRAARSAIFIGFS
jgi:hypothetical protein